MSEPRNFVVIDVGCLECGLPTKLVGVYATREQAVAAAEPHHTNTSDSNVVIYALDGTDRWGDQREPHGGWE